MQQYTQRFPEVLTVFSLTSLPQTKSSNRSVSPGLERWYLARGDMISGWSVMKVGWTHLSSKKSPTYVHIVGSDI